MSLGTTGARAGMEALDHFVPGAKDTFIAIGGVVLLIVIAIGIFVWLGGLFWGKSKSKTDKCKKKGKGQQSVSPIAKQQSKQPPRTIHKVAIVKDQMTVGKDTSQVEGKSNYANLVCDKTLLAECIESWQPAKLSNEVQCIQALSEYIEQNLDTIYWDDILCSSMGMPNITLKTSIAINIKYNIDDKSKFNNLIGEINELTSIYSSNVFIILCGRFKPNWIKELKETTFNDCAVYVSVK